MKVTFQHKHVAEIAVVVEKSFDGTKKISLKANKSRSNDSWVRWALRRCDFVKEFGTEEEAMEAGLKCCPVFHGTAGAVAEIHKVAIDPWGHAVSY